MEIARVADGSLTGNQAFGSLQLALGCSHTATVQFTATTRK